MKPTVSALLVLLFLTAATSATHAVTEPSLPIEPDEDSRLEEIYDHESSMIMFLYSLKGDGNVDYVTGRKVVDNQRSVYGNPVYYVEPYPQFYWWNHAMWNDPERDGVNGNETLYAENTEFDTSRYKPCLFNGQPC